VGVVLGVAEPVGTVVSGIWVDGVVPSVLAGPSVVTGPSVVVGPSVVAGNPVVSGPTIGVVACVLSDETTEVGVPGSSLSPAVSRPAL